VHCALLNWDVGGNNPVNAAFGHSTLTFVSLSSFNYVLFLISPSTQEVNGSALVNAGTFSIFNVSTPIFATS
jgi:hypothetical protein